MSGALDRIKQWFRRAERSVENAAEGAEPVATGAHGGNDGETSTNAQVEGASGEPYPR